MIPIVSGQQADRTQQIRRSTGSLFSIPSFHKHVSPTPDSAKETGETVANGETWTEQITSSSSRKITEAPSFQQLPFDEDPQEIQQNVRPRAGQRDLLRPLSSIDLNMSMGDKKTPNDRSAVLFQEGTEWSFFTANSSQSFCWEAPNIRYKKLYFEDVALERYGQVDCGWRQAFRPAAHWAGSLLSAPIKMRLDPYYDCDTPYGYCRPGECVAPIWQRHVYR